MKLTRVLLASFALALPTYAAAFADTVTFTFSFGSANDTFAGSGVLTASTTSDAPFPTYTVTSISGSTRTTKNGDPIAIAGLYAPGTTITGSNGSYTNDNEIFEVAPGDYELDALGLSYFLANGTANRSPAQINISSALLGVSDSEVLIRTNGNEVDENVQYTIAPTPEPGSFVLLGTGLLGAVGVARRRFAV